VEVREIRVEFKKTVSDGDYGNETYAVAFTVALDESADYLEFASELSGQASDVVLERLKDSTSEGVRSALETPAEREARWKREQFYFFGCRDPREEPSPPLLGDDDPF